MNEGELKVSGVSFTPHYYYKTTPKENIMQRLLHYIVEANTETPTCLPGTTIEELMVWYEGDGATEDYQARWANGEWIVEPADDDVHYAVGELIEEYEHVEGEAMPG